MKPYLIDDLTGDIFQYDYYGKFFSLKKANASLYNTCKNDFINNLWDLISVELDEDDDTAYCIASSLFERMSNSSLHFHTPVKILAMLLFAKRNNIILSVWERLAIYFHCAIFTPVISALEDNRIQSANFLRAILPYGHYLSDNYELNKAEMAIRNMSLHLKDDVSQDFHLLLDLDLCFCVSNAAYYSRTVNYMKKEYLVVQTFDDMYRFFVTKMMSKKIIFRTEFFVEKYEKLLRSNFSAFLTY